MIIPYWIFVNTAYRIIPIKPYSRTKLAFAFFVVLPVFLHFILKMQAIISTPMPRLVANIGAATEFEDYIPINGLLRVFPSVDTPYSIIRSCLKYNGLDSNENIDKLGDEIRSVQMRAALLTLKGCKILNQTTSRSRPAPYTHPRYLISISPLLV